MKGIIFDLDLTLVDTTVLEEYRHTRKWQIAYSMIPHCHLYDGLQEVFNFIRQNDIKVAIVSTAPRTYVEKIVNYFQIPADYIIGYHDAKPIKPSPAPLLKALELLKLAPSEVISFGDRAIDIQASKAASIQSVACFWGSKERTLLQQSGPSTILYTPSEIMRVIKES